jgi:hypothetical protein
MRTRLVFAVLFSFSTLIAISPTSADELQAFRPDSASRFKLLADYAPGAQYKGKPLVKSIFNTYTNSNSGEDSLIVREDFEALNLLSDDSVFVSPYGRTPISISSDQSRTTINSSRQYVLAQGQAALRWINALTCSFVFGTNGNLDYQSKIAIDIKSNTEFSNESEYQELRGLPGLSGRGGGGPIGGAYVSSEQWFSDPINFWPDLEYLNSYLTEESPEGSTIFRISKDELPDEFFGAGKVEFEYGLKCSNALDVSYNFLSTQKLQVTIMPKNGITKFTYNNPVLVSLNDKAIDLDVSSLNTVSPISFKSLSPSVCSGFATSVLLKKVGTCKIAINQVGSEDFSALTENFSFEIFKPIVCIKGKSTIKVSTVPLKCPVGYKKK